MPSVHVRVPDSLRVSGYLTDIKQVKSKLAAILARSDTAPPREHPREVSVTAYVWLNAIEAQRVEDIGKPHNLSVGETITALLVQDHIRQTTHAAERALALAAKPTTTLDMAMQRMGKGVRTEQQRYFEALAPICAPELETPKVLFAECGTGIGKTYAYLALVHEHAAANPTKQIAIAAPTYANLDKLLSDWQDMQGELGAITTVCLAGQNEFVSAQALEALLAELPEDRVSEPTRQAILKWVKSGAHAPRGAKLSHAWTVEALSRVASDFAYIKDVRLDCRDDDEDAGYQSYKSQWAKMPQAQVLVMTHAMMASLIRRRLIAHAKSYKGNDDLKADIAQWRALPSTDRNVALYDVLNRFYASNNDWDKAEHLPDLDLLIVDEAHLLEDAFSLVLSQAVSIWSLRRDVRTLHSETTGVVTAKNLAALDKCWSNLQGAGQASADRVVSLNAENNGVLQDLHDALSSLKLSKRNLTGSAAAAARRLLNQSRSIALALAVGSGYEGSIAANIEWSPDRRWPRLNIGRLSVSRELNYLWQVVAKRTALVSGTLYESIPSLSMETCRRSLAVPHSIALSSSPVHGAWVYERVSVCIVAATSSPDGRLRFVRPRHDASGADELRDAWRFDVAEYLTRTFKSGQGGMLCLGTAYSDIEAVSSLLAKNLPGAHILQQKPGVSLAGLREQFMNIAQAGERPILLAVGGAWTGFDLHMEDQPNALTDLAILNAPFGAIGRSMSRQARLMRPSGMLELASQTLVLVRQGVGRLVRSPETPPNRRLHWLDARIHQSQYAGMLNPVLRELMKYQRVLSVS